ncbi:hypothetical protein ATANTOWER_029641 [Ataeniobius toweri]|uniref:UPAR/Ly6 domain-containing protein n=1 Tax=Ataeniobius toweri TaxID=208326 RepID=A0ABU7BVS9_9TELE|nr:hypothetical protein [Ataeniobius toweri]
MILNTQPELQWKGQALQCYKCDLGFWSLCITSNTTCETDEHCFNGVGVSGLLKIKMKGCLKASQCNKTEDINFPKTSNTTIYSMTKTCCNTDLCNVAPGLPGASGLSLAAVTISSLLAANFMI